jgi:hypothetical protein
MSMLPISINSRVALVIALSVALLGFDLGATTIGPAKMKDTTQDDQNEDRADNESSKLRQAEAACDRAVARLHETLDFQTVFDEMWVTDPALTDRSLGPCFDNVPAGSAGVPDDPELARRWCISSLTVLYLQSQLEMHGDELASKMESSSEMKELTDAMQRLSSSPKGSEGPIAQLKRSILETNRVADLLRRILPPDHFKSGAYRRADEEDRSKAEQTGFPKILIGKDVLGLAEGTPVYEIYRDGFRWCFIEESGQYRLVDLD